MLRAFASQSAARDMACCDFSAEIFRLAVRDSAQSLSYARDEADASSIVRRNLAQISSEGPADISDRSIIACRRTATAAHGRVNIGRAAIV